MIEKEQTSNSINNDSNDSIYNNIFIANGKDNNKVKFQTKLPLPIRKVKKIKSNVQ